MRRVVGAVLAAFALLLLAVPARAAADRPVVRVIQISGLLDRVQADFWQRSIRETKERGGILVVQISSSRSVVDRRGRLALFREMQVVGRMPFAMAIWIGPGRDARVGRSVVPFLYGTTLIGLAPGASIDGPHPAVISRAPTLGDFIVNVPGVPSKIVHPKGSKVPRREPQVDVRFSKPSLAGRTIHGVTSPGPAYALLVFGLLLAVLEFTTAGVGLAAGTAAILLVLACLGLGGLPVNGWAVAAMAFAVFGFGIDVQAGAPRAWTAIGTGFGLYGTLFLYRGGMHVPIVWAIGVIGLTAAFVLAGLPSLVRARFSSPTIGRETFIGEMGTAVGDLSPEGIVNVRGATWRARTNRATPIRDGDAIRVTGIDGLVLDVEPEDGGAKDYRERAKSST